MAEALGLGHIVTLQFSRRRKKHAIQDVVSPAHLRTGNKCHAPKVFGRLGHPIKGLRPWHLVNV